MSIQEMMFVEVEKWINFGVAKSQFLVGKAFSEAFPPTNYTFKFPGNSFCHFFTTTQLSGLELNSGSAGTLLGKSYIYDYKGKVSQVSNTVGSTFGAEYSGIFPYDGLNISDYHDSCREEEGSGSPYPCNACECSNKVFYAEQELGIDCNPSRILYYYHPDYLGHNEYITDITSRPYPYSHYSAFGESLIEKNTNYGQFSSPYRFNGKELDPETGNYYYGARYYNPVWGVWLGVDALAGDFPSFSPYNFVEGNPINLIDPSGKSATCPTCPDGPEFEQAHKSIFDYTYNPETGKATMNDLTNGPTLPEVTVTGESGVSEGGAQGNGGGNGNGVSDGGAQSGGGGDGGLGNWLSGFDIAAGAYSEYGHNHTTYTTTKGIVKNIYKANGEVRSARAAGFARTSRFVKGLGVAGSIVSTTYSGYKVVDQFQTGGIQNVNGWDATDTGVGLLGLGATGAVYLGLISNPVGWAIGAGVLIYSGSRLAYDLYNEP